MAHLTIQRVMLKRAVRLQPVLAEVVAYTITLRAITNLPQCMGVGLPRMMPVLLVTVIPTAVVVENLLSPVVPRVTETPVGPVEVIPIRADLFATPMRKGLATVIPIKTPRTVLESIARRALRGKTAPSARRKENRPIKDL